MLQKTNFWIIGNAAKLLAATLLLLIGISTQAQSKEEKIWRIIGAHDLKTSLAVGSLYFKQEALFSARDLLRKIGKEQDLGADWNPNNAQWQQVEQALIAPIMRDIKRDFHSLEWLAGQWAQENSKHFDAADVDELARHFSTDVGRKQLQIVDHTVSVYVMGALSFTGKLKEGVPGVEQELKLMQQLYHDEDRDMRFNVRENPEGQRFAVSQLGRKYFVSVIQKVTGMINKHIGDYAAGIPRSVGNAMPEAKDFIDEFRRARAG